MAEKNGFFLVVEGIDGIGKTEIARRLVHLLQDSLNGRVKLTFEPHDPSCAGLFIRQVLTRRLRVSPMTLALAFAVNRLDHCEREIAPFLEEGERHVVVCDRYYLSSLVYQSKGGLEMREVWQLNDKAITPDLTIFLDADNQTCQRRMRQRQQEKELFETSLAETRKKYTKAIAFLKDRGETIVEVDASAPIGDVLVSVAEALRKHAPPWVFINLPLPEVTAPKVFSLNGTRQRSIGDEAASFSEYWARGPILGKDALIESLTQLCDAVNARVGTMGFNDLGLLFLDYIDRCGYRRVGQLPWTDLDAYELECTLPAGIKQSGTALLIGEAQRIDTVQKKAINIGSMSSFMLVFMPDPAPLVSQYYERDILKYRNGNRSISPSVRLFSREDIARIVLREAMELYRAEHLQTLRAIPALDEAFQAFAAKVERDGQEASHPPRDP